MSRARSPRAASAVVLVAIGACAAVLPACSQSTRNSGNGDGGSGPCTAGARRCDGLILSVCKAGVWELEAACADDQACYEPLGCVPCIPTQGACMGDRIVLCGDDGKPTRQVTDDCSPSTCVMTGGLALCAGPCDAVALAKSYTGCEYYAVDLPQFGLPGPAATVAADQQFAIAVANPWDVPIDVVVERSDAPLGMPATPMAVARKQVPAKGLLSIPLAPREVSGFVFGKRRSRSHFAPTAYHVTTSRPASVYQFNPMNNPNAYSNDSSLLIPTNAMDQSYVVLGWPGAGGDVDAFGLKIETDKRSFITIVGTAPDTRVRVTSSTNVMAGDNVPVMVPGRSYSFTIGPFEALNLEGADFAKFGATDFSGTRVEADKPIAVWSGVECITINPPGKLPDEGTCCCDHLEEQLFPRSSLGKDYVVVASEPRDHKYPDPEFFRILAIGAGTEVTTSLGAPNDRFTLDAGEVKEIVVRGEDFTVSANQAIEIGQFQVSQDSSFGQTGDPSFELVPPVAQFRPSYIFLTPSGYMENWLLVAAPSGTDLMIDGLAAACDTAMVGTLAGKDWEAQRCQVDPGTHTITAKVPFGLIVVGWGPGPVSYGYTGGMQFEPVNRDCIQDGDCPVAEFCSGGACVPPIQ